MSVITGGILGRVRGKTSGIVFSSARSRLGKVNTAREYVIPANPQTAEQTAQRNLFKRALDIAKGWGPDMYQADMNRAVQQLPGFQSVMSWLLSNVDASDNFTVPGDLPLGDLHFPNTFTVQDGAAAGEIKVTWSEEVGSNGTNSDEIKIIIYAQASDSTKQYDSYLSGGLRSGGSVGYTFSGLDTGDVYIVGLWVVGAGTAEGLISKCSFDDHTAPLSLIHI